MRFVNYVPFPPSVRAVRGRGSIFNGLKQASTPPMARWTPQAETWEQDNAFVVSLDIPGVDPAGIEVNVAQGVLSISGERQATHTVEASAVPDRERRVGYFHRRFRLPQSVDAGRITANGKNGVLTITLPKLPGTQPRRIMIDA